MKTVICGAVESEISLLRDQLNEQCEFLTTGIGLVESALQVNSFLTEQEQIERLIFTGTAGAYEDSALSILDVVQCSKTTLITPLSVLSKAYTPDAMNLYYQLDSIQTDLMDVHIGTVLEITSDVSMANEIVEFSQVQAEHMEIFSIAAACKKFDVKCYAIMGISNIVGPSAHQEWLTNHQKASENAQKSIMSSFFI